MSFVKYGMAASSPFHMLLFYILSVYRNPFIVHIVIETPAALQFFIFPNAQIGTPNPQAQALIRQYALLLASSVLVALAFTGRESDQLSGQVAGALALYHVGPVVRAGSKLSQGVSSMMPWVSILAAHAFCLAGLLQRFWEHYG